MAEQSSRPVVSMPSLDAVDDDMPASTETSATTLSEAVLTTEASFTSTVSTESMFSTNPEVEAVSESFSSAADVFTTNTETYVTTSGVLPPEESFTSSDTPSVDPNQLLESSEPEQTAEEEQIKESESETQIIPEESVALLHQDDTIDEQVEDDPSIAIDQFIKKIADEQLSSKRRELDDEEEHHQEEVQNTSQVADELAQGDSSLEATLTGNHPEDSVNQSDGDHLDGDQIAHDPSSEQTSMEVDEQLTHLETTAEELLNTSAEQKTNEVVESEQLMETEAPAVVQEQAPEPPREKSPVKQMVPKTKERETLPDILMDSSEVSRDPFLIALAQEEIKKLDILVCGGCHLTFYMIEELQEHKNGHCTDVSSVLKFCENEGKPQVWGFSLWKARYLKECGNNPPRPWLLYQKWCKLPQQEKNAWITAGQSVQYVTKMSNAKVASMKKRPVEKDPLAIDLVDGNKENSDVFENTTNIAKKTIVKPVKLNNDVTILPSTKQTTIVDTNTNKAVRSTKNSPAQKHEFAVERILAKRFNPRRKTWEYQIKWENFNNDSNTWEPISNLSHCKQMLEQFEEQLKRVKEEKAKQAALAGKGRGRPTKPSPPPPSGDFTPGRPQRSSKQKATNQIRSWVGGISDDEDSRGTKRQREDDDDDNDADYEVFEKKMKQEQESDDSEEEIKPKSMPIKKVTSTPARSVSQKAQPVNIKSSIVGHPVGQKGKQEILPSNILIPDANGVVRINQKQLPALSSGVYIMSKTAGIIKLDSTTSKVATSGGQTIVKVAPKIGQTQIKIVKKDGNTTRQIIQVQSPQKQNTPATQIVSSINKTNPHKTYPNNKVVPKLKQPAPKIVKPAQSPRTEVIQPPPPQHSQDDESDDGLEPLEFPDEIVVPEPEPENTEFDLDPETGKIRGQEYVDKPVIIKEEPGTRAPTTNELENIVKLAAADITDDDLTNGDVSQDEQDPLDISQNTFRRTSSLGINQGYKQYITKNPNAGQVRRPEGSLLNKALTGTNNSFQRTASGGATPQQRTQPKVVTQRVTNNQPIIQRNTGGLTTRIVTQSRPSQQQSPIVRKVISSTPRPRFSVAAQQQRSTPPGSTVTRIMPQQASAFQMRGGSSPTKVQVYSNKSQVTPGSSQQFAKKVVYGRSSTAPQIVQRTPQKIFSPQKQPQPQTRIVQRYYSSPAKKETPQIVSRQQVKPKQVISMPSLIGEDDLPATPKLAAKPQSLQPNKTPIKSEPISTPAESEDSQEGETSENVATADLSTFTMADSENPIYITGDDGTVYQVAGQNEQGQTILITQGPDGQQQCLLVTNEVAEGAEEGTAAAQTADAEEVAAEAEQPAVSEESMMVSLNSHADGSETSTDIQTPLQIKTDIDIEESTLEEEATDQVVAQVVRAEPPSPGGTHKVVVMLPDGNLMVTQVSPEEYASLELD